MYTFLIAVVVLIGGFFGYSLLAEKIFGADNRKTPAIASPDGVDKIPLGKAKAFLIELLNIAGTGPIFGAVSGALFGPIAFLWIVLGCILGGAVHDYFSGMISSRHDGASIVTLTGKYFGKVMKIIMSVFSVFLLILVTAVFVVSPSSLLQDLTNRTVPSWAWLVIILGYYLIAAILPIDKLIGKLYPFFGAILIAMALMSFAVVGTDKYPLIELIGNLKDYSLSNGGLPAWPFMLITIACGAVSGFHATQTPMVAKCIKTEKEGRHIFYGAMVAEGIIALIWAAVAMAFFHVDQPDGWQTLKELGGGSSRTINEIAHTLLGPVGVACAVIGVVICPITSGDTALRSARLIMGELFHLNQKKVSNRLILTVPLFACVAGLSLWNFLDNNNFQTLWRWFAWANQTMAAMSLWISAIYLMTNCKYKFGWVIAGVPAVFMTVVVTTYLFGEPNISLGKWIPLIWASYIGYAVGGITLSLAIVHFFKTNRWGIFKNYQPKHKTAVQK